MTLAAGFYFSGMRINTTESIPLGIYKTASQAAKKVIMFCFAPQVALFLWRQKAGLYRRWVLRGQHRNDDEENFSC